MKQIWFYEKYNALMINSDDILPDTSGLSFKDHCKELDKAFSLTIEERIKKYGSKELVNEINKQLKIHKGCKLSEYSNL